jgi:sugar lactone lactonase YvrE
VASDLPSASLPITPTENTGTSRSNIACAFQSLPSIDFLRLSFSMAAPHIQRLTVSEPFLQLGSILAEGPFYRPEDDTLHFVDIKAKLLHCVPLSGSGKAKVLQIDDMLGVACFIENDDENYIVAAKRGFGLVNQTTGKLTYIARVFDNEDDELRFPLLRAEI